MARFFKVIAFGAIIGVLIVFAQIIYDITNDVFFYYYRFFAVAVGLGAVIFSVFYSLRYRKKMKEAIKLLEDGKTEEYVEVVEVLIKKVKLPSLKTALKVNLSAGYCSLNDYEKAIKILEGLSHVSMYGALKMVHRLNLCMCYFYSNQWEKAIVLYENNQKVFKSFRKSKLYSGNILLLNIFVAVEKGEFDRAREMLKSAQEKYKNPRLQKHYEYLEGKLQQQREDAV